MKNFMDDDFLLETETAKSLFKNVAQNAPIIDYHNHLSPKEIFNDKHSDSITELWLSGDHYKWRAMRAHGISESLITGDADPYEKFEAWADTVEACIGNPLYHWTHLELQRYFGITTPLNKKSAREIYDKCNELLKKDEYSVRNLLRAQKVKALCTTDDPVDSLKYHRKLREEGFDIKVCPSFRPEKAINIEKEGFADYIKLLENASATPITNVKELLEALSYRLDFFKKSGCRVTDHSLENSFYIPASYSEVDEIFHKGLSGKKLTEKELGKYHGYLLSELGKIYAKKGLAMQLHIGAIRSNSKRFFELLGPDTGFDSVNDFNYAPQLSGLLDSMDRDGLLPKTILYCLNSKDMDMLAAMAGNFQSNEEGIRGKVQLGAAWWFLDNRMGMEKQLESLCSVGLISTFAGMLTDSRSFLSFPRHEYFRRILCNKIGNIVENGEYPNNREYLEKLIEDICFNNANEYFNLKL